MAVELNPFAALNTPLIIAAFIGGAVLGGLVVNWIKG